MTCESEESGTRKQLGWGAGGSPLRSGCRAFARLCELLPEGSRQGSRHWQREGWPTAGAPIYTGRGWLGTPGHTVQWVITVSDFEHQ